MTHHLLKGNETIEEWWRQNGLNHNEARINRQKEYMKQLKETAVAMNRLPIKTIPNPGSDIARRHGCICPVMDNNFGDGLGDGKFWTVQDCPIHGVKDENPTTDQN